MIYPPSQKPPIWSIDPGVIAYNCQRAGMPHPVGAWPFWEGAGNRAMDYSGYNKVGVFVGTGGTWEEHGIDFNGSDWLSLSKRPVYGIVGSEIAMCARCKFSAFQESDVIIKSTNSYMGATIRIEKDHPDNLELYVGDGVAYHYFEFAHGMATDTWYDIVAMYNGTQGEIFVGEVGKPISSIGSKADSFTPNWGTEVLTNRFISDDPNGELHAKVEFVNIFPTNLTLFKINYLHYNPYFMYQIPEELYGYVAGAPPVGAIMNQFQKANLGADLYNGAIIA